MISFCGGQSILRPSFSNMWNTTTTNIDNTDDYNTSTDDDDDDMMMMRWWWWWWWDDDDYDDDDDDDDNDDDILTKISFQTTRSEIDGLVQERCNPVTKALELHLSWTYLSKCHLENCCYFPDDVEWDKAQCKIALSLKITGLHFHFTFQSGDIKQDTILSQITRFQASRHVTELRVPGNKRIEVRESIQVCDWAHGTGWHSACQTLKTVMEDLALHGAEVRTNEDGILFW